MVGTFCTEDFLEGFGALYIIMQTEILYDLYILSFSFNGIALLKFTPAN